MGRTLNSVKHFPNPTGRWSYFFLSLNPDIPLNSINKPPINTTKANPPTTKSNVFVGSMLVAQPYRVSPSSIMQRSRAQSPNPILDFRVPSDMRGGSQG
jgi:hypothetical protein